MLALVRDGTTSLRFTHTAFSFAIPERVAFRYRLEGVDRDWQQGADRRAICYSNLAPGDYRFEVTATNEDGVWNRDPAVFDVHIRPTFVQTRWFTFLLVLVGVLVLSAACACSLMWVLLQVDRAAVPSRTAAATVAAPALARPDSKTRPAGHTIGDNARVRR